LLYSVYQGERNNAKANAIQKNLKDPAFQIPPEFYQNREIARQMAQQGIPQQQYNNATNNINQNQAAAISAAQNSNNPGGNIAAIARQGNQAKATLDAEDAQARQANQRYFIQQNAQIGNQQLQKQQNDVYDKFTRDFNQMQAYKGAAQDNFNGAAQGALQLGQTYMTDRMNNPVTPNGSWTPGTMGAKKNAYNVDATGMGLPPDALNYPIGQYQIPAA